MYPSNAFTPVFGHAGLIIVAPGAPLAAKLLHAAIMLLLNNASGAEKPWRHFAVELPG